MAFGHLRCGWLALAVIFLSRGYVSAQWEWRNPLPQGNSLADIQAFSSSVCYAAGGRGTFLTTTSGGDTWRLVSIEGMPDLTYLQFFGQSTGILIGNRDSISQLLWTTNQGAQWTERHPAADMVTSAYLLNADTGWAATETALLFTSDGGTNWSKRTLPGAGITRLFFLNSLTGWGLGRDTVFRTVDGGASWLGVRPDSMQGWISNLDKITFVSLQVGWVTGTSRGPNHFSGHILKSTDGGGHWTEQFTVGEDFVDYRTFSDIEMRSEQLGWAVSAGRVYKTGDGGKSWNEIARVPYLEQISTLDDTHLWGCGSYGAIYYSSDGGATWIPKHRGAIGLLNDLCWLDEKTGFAAGDTLLLKTRNGGQTWEASPVLVPHQEHFNIHSVWFIDSLRGWLGVERSGGGGSLILTTDGGENWQTQLDSVNRIFSLFFSGQNFGWASSGNKVYRTTDRGATWQAGGSSTNPGEIESLFFTSPDSGWAGGYLGLAQTTNGGLSWSTVLPAGFVGIFVKGIHFTTPLVGWAVGYSGNDGYIFKTEDGGKSWQSQAHPAASMSTWPLGVAFAGENRGWVVGQSLNGGFAFHTTDGGVHWEEDEAPLDRPFLRARSQRSDIWILGDHGAILRRSLNGTATLEQFDEGRSAISYKLEQNYPNPFNPKTVVSYQLPVVSKMTLKVYDILGQEVATLVNEVQPAGTYKVIWDAGGNASGVYLCRLSTGLYVETRKLLLIR